MKKALSLILALVLCLSLCACGGTTNSTEPTEKELKELVIGTWEYTYIATSSGLTYTVGDKMRQTVELYKGGTGKYHYYNDTNNQEYGNPTLTWEIKDDVINITLMGGQVMAFTFDATTDTMTRLDYSWIYERAE